MARPALNNPNQSGAFKSGQRADLRSLADAPLHEIFGGQRHIWRTTKIRPMPYGEEDDQGLAGKTRSSLEQIELYRAFEEPRKAALPMFLNPNSLNLNFTRTHDRYLLKG